MFLEKKHVVGGVRGRPNRDFLKKLHVKEANLKEVFWKHVNQSLYVHISQALQMYTQLYALLVS